MSGWANWAQAKIKEMNPHAIYVLVIHIAWTLFLLIHWGVFPSCQIYLALCKSFMYFLAIQLQDTRCLEKSMIKLDLGMRLAALVAVIEMKNKVNSVNIAIDLLNRLKSPEFIISMFCWLLKKFWK